jgi:hypothetical protein
LTFKGQLFAQCRHEQATTTTDSTTSTTVEQVMDSSRYFVVKVEDPQTGRHAFLGVGFQERNDSFDFNVALQDHFKNLKLQQETEKRRLNKNTDEQAVDYSLKEGQQISINIGNLSKKKQQQQQQSESNSGHSIGSGSGSAATTKPSDWVQF